MAVFSNSVKVIIILYSFSLMTENIRSAPFMISNTTVLTLKKGLQIQGRVMRLSNGKVPVVEVYLGVPYAAPPVGQFRFMPPTSDVSWIGVKYANSFGPVCPQSFPDESSMSTERKTQFWNMKRHLLDQSEDCLYLNIYAPLQGPSPRARKYPVMVFIHGESFEWNSGNLYDGSVLAAVGNVIVVTLNFRLGILGFLKLEAEETTRQSNFGLMDQLAALVWLQDNIGEFGGDPTNVTLMGHGTGAVCASLFTISPLALRGDQNLFHRAIFMSGSVLSDWALVTDPNNISYQVAGKLECEVEDNFAACLRKKRLEEIMAAVPVREPFKTTFGPVIDNLFVPNDPEKSMYQYVGIFKRFELMYGVTELESKNLPLGGDVLLRYGMLEKDRDAILMDYMKTRCEIRPSNCVVQVKAKYNYEKLMFQGDPEFRKYRNHEPDRATFARDELLDILSDARTVAPIIKTGLYHSTLHIQSYFYVFTHKTNSKDYTINKTYNGEELPYVFGVPKDQAGFDFDGVVYNEEEEMLSQSIINYFCNFAHTGSPNIPRERFPPLEYNKWHKYDVEWPDFNATDQYYIKFDVPIGRDQLYREKWMHFWNSEFPHLKTPKNPLPWANETIVRNVDMIKEEVFGTPRIYGEGARPDYDNNVYGTLRTSPAAKVTEITQSSSSLFVFLIAGSLFLLVNVIFFVFVYFKCIKKRKCSTEDDPPNEDNIDDKYDRPEDNLLFGDCNIVKILSKSKIEETYETLNVDAKVVADGKLTRHLSSSTIDAHVKVRDWIANEIINKYSPKNLRKPKKGKQPEQELFSVQFSAATDKSSTLGRSPTRPVSPSEDVSNIPRPLLIKTASIDSSKHRKRPGKVSVAIDATPSGRGPSVLMQQPIELTKYLKPLRRSVTLEDFSPRKVDDTSADIRKSVNNVGIDYLNTEPTVIRIEHGHSKSDPVQDINYSNIRKLKTFDPNCDVNVTSRDDNYEPQPLTPEEALMTIKRRNFPKVLPDHPGRDVLMSKRRSMPVQNGFYPIFENAQYSSSEPYSPTGRNFMKYPPVPPPRSSTLGRQVSNPQPVCLSEPTLVEEPSPSPEPEITCNNLYVGPLIPKNKNAHSLEKVHQYETKEIKGIPKAIITANPNNPIKRVDPKVVVKPTINRHKSDDKPKNIPRVVVPDNRPELVCTSKPVEETTESKAVKPKKTQIPTLIKGCGKDSSATKSSNATLNKEPSGSDSTSPSDESDTGTVVKRV